MCAGPYRRGVEEWPCGKCLPCLMNQRRIWVSRLMLESQAHARLSFITLTYNRDHVPPDGSVSKRHVQLFLKRLRKLIAPLKVRYFFVGEYGEQNLRPHYHAVLFGVDDVSTVREAWKLDDVEIGFVHLGMVTPQSINYVVGYVTKRITNRSDKRLEGKEPEFSLMSRRPGIGSNAVGAFVDAYTTEGGCIGLARSGDVAHEYRVSGRKWPLGRYMREKLRVALGRPSGEPERLRHSRLQDMREELRIPGATELREARRLATLERAKARVAIVNSKKGKGV